MWYSRYNFTFNGTYITIYHYKGQASEYRNDLLFIASFMVLISLILAQIVLP